MCYFVCVNSANFCGQIRCIVREKLLRSLGCLAGYGASIVIQGVRLCEELGLDGLDSISFHGGLVMMVGGLVDLYQNPCFTRS